MFARAHCHRPPAHSRPAYIALLSILIVSAMAAATVLILFVTGVTTTMNSADTYGGTLAKSLADACAERALQSLTSCTLLCRDGNPPVCDDSSPPTCNAATPYEITFGSGKCQIVSIANPAGNNWRIRTIGITGNIQKRLEVEAVKIPPPALLAATVAAWRECLDFSTSYPTPCPTP